jgi:hypothetical protein
MLIILTLPPAKSIEFALGLVVLLIFLYSVLKGGTGIAQALSPGAGNCQLPLNPTKHGPANIIVSTQPYYSSFTGQGDCSVTDVTVQITGANPGDDFEVFQNAFIISGSGSSGGCDWTKLAGGKTDLNGSLTINTRAYNPSSTGQAQILIGVKDSSCENVLVVKGPTLCSISTYHKEIGYRQLTFKQWSALFDKATQ